MGNVKCTQCFIVPKQKGSRMKKRRPLRQRSFTRHNPRDKNEKYEEDMKRRVENTRYVLRNNITPFPPDVDPSSFETEADRMNKMIKNHPIDQRLVIPRGYSPLPEMEDGIPVVLYCMHSSCCDRTAFVHNGRPLWGYDPEKTKMVKRGSPSRSDYCDEHVVH